MCSLRTTKACLFRKWSHSREEIEKPKSCASLMTSLGTFLFALWNLCVDCSHFFSKISSILTIMCFGQLTLMVCILQIDLKSSYFPPTSWAFFVAQLQVQASQRCRLFRRKIFVNIRANIFGNDFWVWNLQKCRLKVSQTHLRFLSKVCCGKQPGLLPFCILPYKVWIDLIIVLRFEVFWSAWFL